MSFVVEVPVSPKVEPSGAMLFISGELVPVTNGALEIIPPQGYPACPKRERCVDGTSHVTHHYVKSQELGEVCPVIQQLASQGNKQAVCLHCQSSH